MSPSSVFLLCPQLRGLLQLWGWRLLQLWGWRLLPEPPQASQISSTPTPELGLLWQWRWPALWGLRLLLWGLRLLLWGLLLWGLLLNWVMKTN